MLKNAIKASCFFTLFAASGYANHNWNNYHWARTTTAFNLQVVDSMTASWEGELVEALSRWSYSNVISLAITSANDSHHTRKRCRMVKGQIRVCNAEYGFNGWLGLATIGLDASGHIDRGTAKMNDSYTSYWAILGEKNHVICQEIGHVLGLGHTSEDGTSQKTCMDYSTDLDSQWPNGHDYSELESIYQHVDSYDSYANSSTTESIEGCNAPPDKGCNKKANNNVGADIPPMGVRVHKGRSHELWAAPRRDGGLWIHHIRLVPEGY
ncbi:hypothetical protein H0A36_21540 [Endozoicomonas sp. SM1973]|uniref:Peptidase metallopeptidase domain-containing protein n=1 Tax=Spartinivicinus marinus TaxID=2994442 RepID=A0A853I5I7_9GAMM|nr:hypothetical protein [Spartinivicinus marinus]MCX4027124.1 hypothetical protein [Spartinivicinus marinus]NYZ68603.1 hypothetical protein [Spartinivicinus marinus]